LVFLEKKMNIFDTLKKVAGELDQLGYFEQADELDGIIEAAAAADLLEKQASGQVQIDVKEDVPQNQWLVQTPDGQLTVSSPIYQTAELKAAGDKAPGIQAMKIELHKQLGVYLAKHPGLKAVIMDPRFR
jgi:hypothetical protein